MPQNDMTGNEVVQVKTRTGKVVPVYKKNLAEAMKLGATPVVIADKDKNVGAPTSDNSENSFKESMRGAMGFDPKGGFKSDIKDIGTGFKHEATDPLDSVRLLLQSMSKAQQGTIDRAYQEQQSPNLGTKAHGFVRGLYSAIPGLGPLLERAGEQTEAGHYKGAAGTMTPILAGQVLKSPAVEDLAVRGAEKVAEIPGKVVEGIKEAPPTIVQNISGAKHTVNKAERAAGEAVQDRAKEVAEQREAKEIRDKETLEANKKFQNESLTEAKSKDLAATQKQITETKAKAKEFQENLAKKHKTEAENAQLVAQRKNLQQTVAQKTKQFTDNTNQVLAKAKESFDKEYGDFDTKILGKNTEHPLKAPLSPTVEAVMNAQKNIIEGTPENIKPFRSILSRTTEVEDVGGGRAPVLDPNQTINVSDLRGYVSELEAKIYGSNLLPDVKTALKSVVEAGKDEISSAIRDVHGKTAESAYHDLNSRYSDYLTDWRDTSSVNPLPKIREKLLDPVTQNNPGVLENLDLTGTVKAGNKGQTALTLLDKYRKFGADPEILRSLQKSVEQLKALDKLKKVPEVKKPEYPAASKVTPLKTQQPPKIEEFKPRGKEPKPFDRQQLMRDTLEDRMNWAGRIGQVLKIMKLPLQAWHGDVGGMLSDTAWVGGIEGMRQLLTNPKVLDYLSREKEKI